MTTPTSVRRTAIAAALALVLVCAAVAGWTTIRHGSDTGAPGAAGATPAPADPALHAVARQGLTQARDRFGPGDAFYLADTTWHTGGPPCPSCNLGPAAVAAALAARTTDPHLLELTVRTVEAALERQTPDGAFPAARPELGPDIETAATAWQIGFAAYTLGPALSAAQRARWAAAVHDAVGFLDANGNYAWYTNGNITLANALVAALAWKLTGDTRDESVYRRALDFAQHPPPHRWTGMGLVVTTPPTRPDGSDGAGYLTETGAGQPGFDADYTQVQADAAALIALVTGDPAAIRLTNLLVNSLLPRVDRRTWLLDTSAGTRHPEPHRAVPFSTAAVTVLAAHGRADLHHLAATQRHTAARHLIDDRGDAAYPMWASRLAPALLVTTP